ncbi:MAG: hypothetical protein IPO04_13755 [Cytophagaceae bacterium]|nr:hypothetical protein [Cytophagaceae bacterium]
MKYSKPKFILGIVSLIIILIVLFAYKFDYENLRDYEIDNFGHLKKNERLIDKIKFVLSGEYFKKIKTKEKLKTKKWKLHRIIKSNNQVVINKNDTLCSCDILQSLYFFDSLSTQYVSSDNKLPRKYFFLEGNKLLLFGNDKGESDIVTKSILKLELLKSDTLIISYFGQIGCYYPQKLFPVFQPPEKLKIDLLI